MIAQVTPQTANDILNDKRLIVMWFSGIGCGPCKQAEPIVKDIARQRWPAIVVAQADLDENEELAKQYDVKFVPTILLFKNHNVVDKIIGIKDDFKSKLVHSIATHL